MKRTFETLQEVIDRGVKHGDSFTCPACGSPGRIDINTKSGETPEFLSSVWWNTNTENWECDECWLK